MLLEGMSVPQIGRKLGISFHTANAHYRSIYRKLDISSRKELFMKYRSGEQR